jgi:hypothetical protein
MKVDCLFWQPGKRRPIHFGSVALSFEQWLALNKGVHKRLEEQSTHNL